MTAYRSHAMRTTARSILAAVLATTMALSLANTPAWAAPVAGKPPAPKPIDPVATHPVAAVGRPAGMAIPDGTKRPAAVWPAGTAEVVVPAAAPRGRLFGQDAAGAAQAGGLPVWVSRAASGSAPGRLRVEAFDRTRTAAAGVPGLLLRVTGADGVAGTGTAQVTVDYRGFRNAYGAGWASRLRLVVLPQCALSTPGRTECAGRVVPSTNDWRGGSVTGTVPVDGKAGTLVALMAGTSGPSGDFKATSLAPSSTWSAGGNSGDFSWSYPMRVPPAVGGPAPQLGLSYSAQSVDGRQPATNSQPSIVGEGFELSAGGFIERRYKACNDDKVGGNNSTDVGDQCWATDNATLSLAGHSGELIFNAAEARWHLRSDDGSRIQRFTGAVNGDNDGEYWVVTTTDGTQYWFGANRLTGWTSGKPETNSTWTAPVFGNHVNEPCHAAAFAGSACDQAWRWNLDHVVDVSGNTMSLWYGKDSNKYARNLATSSPVTYNRGGWLDHIDYGTDNRSGPDTVYTGNAPARIVFGYGDRCLAGCATHDGTHWPDTPWDTECAGSTCNTVSPTFWTTRRLATVTTRVWDTAASTHRDVERWTLGHTFPDPGDTNRPGLWLDRIGHTGLVGGHNTTVPDVVFTPVSLNNRVDGIDFASSMNWHRIAKITTETGGTISITYQGSDCTATGPKPIVHNNTSRCYPVKWKPEGFTTPVLDWFHKYVVTTIYEADETGGVPPHGSPRVAYNYTYLGAPAWHYSDDDGLIQPDYKTWSVWRGYAEVAVAVGDPGEQTYSKTRYFRGMHGDKQLPSGTRTVTIDGINDEDWWAGAVREQITYNGPGGPEVGATVNDPWASAATASRTINGDLVEARFTNTAVVTTRTALDGGRPARLTRSTTTFDGYGMTTQVDDEGDLGVANDQQCVKTTFEPRNTTAWILGASHEVRTFAVGCTAAANPATLGDADVIADIRTTYDGHGWGVAPTQGRSTLTQQAKTWNSGSPTFVTASGQTFDAHGRTVDTWDALGRHTTTAYTPSSGGPVTATAVTNALTHVTTTYLDPAWGLPVAMVDANDKRTDLAYDGLGRLTAVWLPGRAKATQTANTTFTYLIRNNAPSVVSTSRLNPSGFAYLTAYALFDGMLRARQTQRLSPEPSGGRIIDDTFYDTAGRTRLTYGVYYTTGSAGTTLVQPNDPTDVPHQTRTVYDGAGRPTGAIFQPNAVERWRTSAGYGGDRTDITPPTGGTATSTVTDGRGRTVQVRQYEATTPTGVFDANTYTYNRKGQLATVTDPVGNHWDYGYDLLGRQTTTADPDKGTTTFTYDDAGQLKTTVDARNKKLVYTYDQLGRRTAMYQTQVASGTQRAQWTYDTIAKGHLTKSIRYVGVTAPPQYIDEVTSYDDGYRPTGRTITIPSSETGLNGFYQFGYTYNVDGSMAQAGFSEAGDLPEEALTYDYDDLGLPWQLTSYYDSSVNLSYVSETRHNALAQIDRLTLQTGATSSKVWLNYDRELETGRLVGLTTTRQTGTQTTLSDLDYSHDHAGNITKISDTVSGDQQCLRQDHLRRLTDAWTPSSGNCATNPTAAGLGGPAPYWQSWTYDKTGNRLTQTEHATPNGDATTTYTIPAAGAVRPHTVTGTSRTDNAGTQTGSYTYDAAGNTLTRPTPTSGQQTLTWDPEGHLATSADTTGTTTYIYDANGNRLIRRDPTGKTLYLPGQELRYDTASNTRTCTRYYTYNGATVASRTSAGLTWLAGDHQGTAQLAIDATTQTFTVRRQTPFGAPRGSVATWPNPRGFVGGTNDNTGLTHLGAREYDPLIGRFISVDPLMNLGDPQTLHGYAYANNAAISLSDPSGLAPPPRCNDMGDCAIGSTPLSGAQPPPPPPNSHPAADKAAEEEREAAKQAFLTTFTDDFYACGAYLRGNCETVRQAVQRDEMDLMTAMLHVFCGGNGECVREYYSRGGSLEAFLTVLGMFPVVGEVADAASALLALSKGDYKGAALSLAAVIPILGVAAGLKRLKQLDGKCSFSGDTPVLLADGASKPISQIEVGDIVLATDPTTGEEGPSEVTHLWVHDDQLVALDLGDRSITTTEDHPFWNDTDKQWQRTDALDPGDLLLSTNGLHVRVTGIRPDTAHTANAYNLTIAGIHTYYVMAGIMPVLVHNTGPACGVPGGARNLQNGALMATSDAMDTAVEFLGAGYRDMGGGRFLSKDGLRQVRLTDADLAHPTQNPHLNFETYSQPIGPGVRGGQPISNIHIYLPEESGWRLP